MVALYAETLRVSPLRYAPVTLLGKKEQTLSLDRSKGAPYLARFWRDVGYGNCLLTHASGKTELSWRFFSWGTGAYPDFPLRSASDDHVCLRKVDHRLCRPTGHETGRGHPLFPSHQLCPGAPRSHQRTWVNQDGAKPHQSSVFSLLRQKVFLLREPHAVHKHHESQREIPGSAVERPAVSLRRVLRLQHGSTLSAGC